MGAADTASRLRFPILFSGILGLLVTGFAYRKNFMQDLDDKRASMGQEDKDAKELLESAKHNAKMIKQGKNDL